jgi:hypothetical protein
VVVVVVIIIIVIVVVKYLSFVVTLLGLINNTAFLHDLTSRPGFTTGWHVSL